ncbi:MAG TPA: HAD family hydrolase [Candidatus Binatia bacterium]|nr:HAD family hydrolase [Candidatus Binatia bacterium]
MGEPLAVAAITLDFGNTLVRTDRASFAAVVEETASRLARRGLVADRAAFLATWAEERDRQFREEVPKLREVDIHQRAIRVLARLGGVAAPAGDGRWDDEAAAAAVDQDAVEAVVDDYSAAFIDRMRPMEDAAATLERLSGEGFALAILSNWPLAVTIDRYAATQGWLPYLRAIVVSQRVGVIKPHPDIFAAARSELGFGANERGTGAAILHVGDDWAADVVGAKRAGWQAAYLRDRQHDTPLPTSEPGDGLAAGEDVAADLVIDELADLAGAVVLDAATAATLAPAAPLAVPARGG